MRARYRAASPKNGSNRSRHIERTKTMLLSFRTRTDADYAQGYSEGLADFDAHRLSGFCSQSYREGWERGYGDRMLIFNNVAQRFGYADYADLKQKQC
jgi:hypothetical protein